MHRKLTLLAGILSATAAAGADMDRLLEMPFEQLLQVEVFTVSKREEMLTDAPGVVSVITADDISRFGARNLKDILLRVPNLYMFDSSTFTATGSTLRAGATQHLNNHVLYLLNGRPLRESQNGGLHTDINLLLPVSSIERIEFIRGPGSVLYGSNAFDGTVNIITRRSDKNLEGSLRSQFGSNDFWMNSAHLAGKIAKDGDFSLRLSDLSDDGEVIQAIDDQGQNGQMPLSRDGSMAWVQAQYAGFSVEGIYSEIEHPSISGPFRWTGLSDFMFRRKYLDLGYQHQVGSKWLLDFHYTLNQHERHIDGPNELLFEADGYLYEVSLAGELSEGLNLLAGVVMDQVRGDLGESRGGSYDNLRRGVYGQVDVSINPQAKVTAGLQWNEPEGQTGELSPRLAFLYHWNASLSGKLLYAQAFRSPYGSEIGFESSFLQGDPNLQPEEIETWEAQLLYGQEALSLTGTLYRSETENGIGRSRIGSTTFFVNQDTEVVYYGVELEADWVISPGWRLQGNTSYQTNEDEQGNDDVMMGSNVMFKIGLSYQPGSGYSVGLWNSYFGAVSKLEDQPAAQVDVVNPAADVYNLLSVNFQANVGELISRDSWRALEVGVYVDNLLDEEVWYPEMGQKSVNTYPQSHFRGVYTTMTLSF